MSNNTPPTTKTQAIAYFRVSTRKQGATGLGMAAQMEAVARYAHANGLTIARSFTEVETGTRKGNRPELTAALALARQTGAVLLIAKLDRLARNVAFISGLMEAGVAFVACDMPSVTNLTLHIISAVAEEEARLISERTRAALAVKRARDGEWRVSNLDAAARLAGAAANRQRAVEAGRSVAYTAGLLRETGMTLRAIADQLNDNGYLTRQGKQFTAMTVKRLLDRQAE